jgi:hypothetical protein
MPTGPPSRSSVVPPLDAPEALGAQGIVARATTIEHEDYFDVLGVPRGAAPEVIRSAFLRLAEVWPPDRLPAHLGPFRGEASRIFACLSRAHATLIDPDARRQWLATRENGKRAAPRPRDEVLIEVNQLLGRGEIALVASLATDLLRRDEQDLEARAIVAWCRASSAEASPAVLRAGIVELDRVINNDRTCMRAFWYRGVLHKRLDEPKLAHRDFLRVTQLDSKHVEALREVRLFEMRMRKASERPLDALLSKMTGKK